MQRSHTRVSPSYLPSALYCPASVTLASPTPQPSSRAMRLGTAKHTAVELRAAGKKLPRHIVVEGEKFEVDDEFAEQVGYCEGVIEMLRETEDEIAIEARGDLNWYFAPLAPPVPFSGHIDLTSFSARKKRLTVLDWKFGHHGVSPLSPQLMAYAAFMLGAYAPDMPETVRLIVVQPPLADERVKTVELPTTELMRWVETELTPALRRIMEGDTAENPGEGQCRFCRRAAECGALREQTNAVALRALDGVTPGITDDELGGLLTKFALVEQFMKNARQEATARLQRGAAIPGWKIVDKQSNRSWVDDESVRQRLAHDIFADIPIADIFTSPVLRSPAQIEKACKQHGVPFDALAELITREVTGVALVPESNKRAAATTALSLLD